MNKKGEVFALGFVFIVVSVIVGDQTCIVLSVLFTLFAPMVV